MKKKLVKESLEEPIVMESIKMGNHQYDVFKIGSLTKIFAGKDGILGKDGELISWDIVKQLMQKFNIK
jgi:hypothetical protein